MRIGLVGIGKWGTPVGLRLLAAGHELAVWNRTEERTKPLIHEGAIAAGTPAEAEVGAEAVISMLRDDAAYQDVLFGVHGLMEEFTAGSLHIACGAISVALCQRLSADHASRGIDFVVAHILDDVSDTGQGRVRILAAGAEAAVARARPLLEIFSESIAVAGGDAWQACASKSR